MDRYVLILFSYTWIPNPDNLPEVNHIGLDENGVEGNKKDNRVVSLVWCTESDNIKHGYKHGLLKPTYGSINGMSKLTEKEVLEIRELAKTLKGTEIAKKYNVRTSTISRIVNRRMWGHI